ncbi:biotin-dependent carboxyltransferase family protein [Motilimonas pumila]|uniref:Biotin-dependent carboxyltransferase family protein n=1 Tax=Motilimonas pumila TaxID=2303987 RepID=A0A418YCA0_9GAMM|nr:biotin-dependent carboxyltransferase family protein [Motilimonas pumila]RJG42144.1 biotin-dependent carboxyltransferase family protein [Motilimonas pumila]
MSFEVINPGLHTSLQDLGRFGHQHVGITTGGPFDLKAFCWANKLLANPVNAPCLEITLGQFSARATAATVIAITGADMHASINHRPITAWRSYSLAAGDELRFGVCQQGMRAYLSVQGGFTTAHTLGSVSTVQREKLGGLNQGLAIKAKETLSFTPVSRGRDQQHKTRVENQQKVPSAYQPAYANSVTLEVFKGPQWRQFNHAQQRHFLAQQYSVLPASNRMALCLQAEPLEHRVAGIVSQGVSLGAIQMPPSGQPVALLNDRQTIGGYAKIANLTTQACWQVAQLRPQDTVQFALTDIAAARQSLQQVYRFFELPF